MNKKTKVCIDILMSKVTQEEKDELVALKKTYPNVDTVADVKNFKEKYHADMKNDKRFEKGFRPITIHRLTLCCVEALPIIVKLYLGNPQTKIINVELDESGKCHLTFKALLLRDMNHAKYMYVSGYFVGNQKDPNMILSFLNSWTKDQSKPDSEFYHASGHSLYDMRIFTPVPHRLTMKETACCDCKKIGTNVKCKGCNTVRYCSKTCQKRHWPEHKKQCTRIDKPVDIMNFKSASLEFRFKNDKGTSVISTGLFNLNTK
jgi:hypothetical protein